MTATLDDLLVRKFKNTADGIVAFISEVKALVHPPGTTTIGVDHGLRRKHLQSYLVEFVFRFNRRRIRHAAFRSLLSMGFVSKYRPMRRANSCVAT